MGVTEDLMKKCAADVQSALHRNIALADERLPVAISGLGAGVGTVAALLEQMGPLEPGEEPDPEAIFLAALIVARTGTSHPDAIGQAYADLEKLKPLV